jgi:hypothetical protein
MTSNAMTEEFPAGTEDAADPLPPIYCPVPPVTHPASELANRRAIDWMNRIGFCEDPRRRARIDGINMGALMGAFFPDADVAALEAITKYNLWVFAVDDVIEELASRDLVQSTNLQGRLMRVLDAPRCAVGNDDPHCIALRDIHGWFSQINSRAVVDRWIEYWRVFMFGVAWGCAYRQKDTVPTPDDFTTIRLQDVGAGCTVVALIELAGGFEVPAEELARDDVQTLIDIMSVIAGWDNDIYSYSAEAENGIDHINFVTSLAVHHSLTTSQALRKAIHMRNRAMWRYLDLRSKLELPQEQPLYRFLATLDHLVRASLDWGMNMTQRYDFAKHRAPTLTLHEEPASHIDGYDITQPVDLPSIRWWWDTV